MIDPDHILADISHRPWEIPDTAWRYYQEWNNVIFLHWQVQEDELERLVPSNITVDTFGGNSWVSLVAFTMEKIKPGLLPPIAAISDFHEINVRTYVTKNNKPGVYFLSIEAEKLLSVFIAKHLSGLPYTKAVIKRSNDECQMYASMNIEKQFQFDISFKIGAEIDSPAALDRWLTERYCLYFDKSSHTFRYEIHHKPWKLFDVEIIKLETEYTIGDINLSRKPDLAHFSDGVKVIAWPRQRLD